MLMIVTHALIPFQINCECESMGNLQFVQRWEMQWLEMEINKRRENHKNRGEFMSSFKHISNLHAPYTFVHILKLFHDYVQIPMNA